MAYNPGPVTSGHSNVHHDRRSDICLILITLLKCMRGHSKEFKCWSADSQGESIQVVTECFNSRPQTFFVWGVGRDREWEASLAYQYLLIGYGTLGVGSFVIPLGITLQLGCWIICYTFWYCIVTWIINKIAGRLEVNVLLMDSQCTSPGYII